MSLQGIASGSTASKWDALSQGARWAWHVIAVLFLAEQARWPLWLPVLVGIGIAVYFASAVELGPVAFISTLACVLLAGLAARRRPGLLLIPALFGALLVGYGAAALRSAMVSAPVLERPLTMVLVSGVVADVEPLANDGMRVVLEHLAFENRSVDAVPERIRLRLPPKSPTVHPGERIRLFASLMAPSGPVLPGGFDFARLAWFQGLGAVGYGMGKVESLEPIDAKPGLAQELAIGIARLRQIMTKRILNVLPGDTGAVAAALVTGGERAISKPLLDAYRDSGLAHLLSVSGLHISLVAGLVFVGLRALLALIRPLALRYPIKKWTAFGAAGAALFYLFVSGAFVPTQRSFLMTAIVLLGVVLDRQAISMRLVAMAALFILLTQPESLLGASFQMSFAAVLGLVAAYELAHAPISAWRRQGGAWRGVALYVGMLVLSSLVASLATAPFAIDNFNRFNPFGLASNMIAVPLSGVLVMPAALVSVLLMPLGLERLALIPMGWGVDLINAVAYRVSSWPGAGLAVPSYPLAGYIALVMGGLWLMLMRQTWRLLGLAGIAFGFFSLLTVSQPDLLIDGQGKLVAIRNADGLVAMTPGKKDPITREAWRRHLAVQEEPEALGQGALGGLVTCDGLGCRAVLRGVAVSLVKRPEALVEDCKSSGLLVASFMVPDWACKGPRIIARRERLRRGAQAVWFQDGRIARIEAVNDATGPRPWASQPSGKYAAGKAKQRSVTTTTEDSAARPDSDEAGDESVPPAESQ